MTIWNNYFGNIQFSEYIYDQNRYHSVVLI